MVTITHATVILSSTIASFMLDNVYKIFTQKSWELYASVYFFTAVSEIFLSYNMFFILDDDKIDIINDRGYNYPVV